MKKGLWWAQAVLALVLTVAIIGTSVVGTLAFRPLYYEDMENLQIPEESGYSEEEVRANYDALIDYNLAWEDTELSLPTIPMSENGETHFEEVKEIFDIFKYLALLGGSLGVIGIVFMARKREYRYLKMTAVLSTTLPIVLGVLVALFWEPVFMLFHEIFFDNDYWLFDPKTDPVINILPDAYFMHCAIMIFGGVLLGATVCAVSYLVLRKCGMKRGKIN